MEIKIHTDDYNYNSSLTAKGEFSLQLKGCNLDLDIDYKNFEILKSKLSEQIQKQYNDINLVARQNDEYVKVMSKFIKIMKVDYDLTSWGEFDESISTLDIGNEILSLYNVFWDRETRLEYINNKKSEE